MRSIIHAWTNFWFGECFLRFSPHVELVLQIEWKKRKLKKKFVKFSKHISKNSSFYQKTLKIKFHLKFPQTKPLSSRFKIFFRPSISLQIASGKHFFQPSFLYFSGLTRPALYPFPATQYPYPMLSPEMTAASWHTPSMYSAATGFRSPYPSSLPINSISRWA